MTVMQGQARCPGVLVESVPGVGKCDREEQCDALALRADYIAYRNAHTRISSDWLVSSR